jgi:hypothetical protein
MKSLYILGAAAVLTLSLSACEEDQEEANGTGGALATGGEMNGTGGGVNGTGGGLIGTGGGMIGTGGGMLGTGGAL